VVTPVGSNQEWRGELDQLQIPIIIDPKKFPCKSILSTAHPAFDYSGEVRCLQLITADRRLVL
jgi:hypothetical protein